MATIITYPTANQGWLPSRNPIICTLSTTNTMPRLSYIINVYINGTLATKMKYPVYNRNVLSVDLRAVVNDFLTDVFVNKQATFTTVPDEVASLELVIDEEYFNTNQNKMVVDTNTALTRTKIYLWRAVADFQASREIWDFYKNFDLTLPSYSRFGKFLGVKNHCLDVPFNTDNGTPPTGKNALFRNLYKIHPYTERTTEFFAITQYSNYESSHTKYLHLWAFNEKKQLTKTFFKQIHAGNLWAYTDKIGVIPVGAVALNNLTWDNITLYAGNTSALTTLEDKYYFVTVCGANASGAATITPTQTTPAGFQWLGFELVECEKYKTYNILYKTADGGWWQIRANKKNYKSTDVKTTVKFNTWGMNAQETLPSDKRFIETMHTEANGSIVLNTDWIENNGIVEEIEQMIVSPSIYLVSDDLENVYIPVILKDTSVSIKDKQQDKMFQYSFEFSEAFKKGTLK